MGAILKKLPFCASLDHLNLVNDAQIGRSIGQKASLHRGRSVFA
jgi:hypothetical protein